jgi:hypothetical protein
MSVFVIHYDYCIGCGIPLCTCGGCQNNFCEEPACSCKNENQK